MTGFCLPFILLSLAVSSSGLPSNCSADSYSPYDTVTLSSALTKFSETLYQATSLSVGKFNNFIIAPASISFVLAMTLVGARDNTAKEIKEALYLTNQTDQNIFCAFGALNRVDKVENGVNLKSVNRILVSDDFRLAEFFRFTLQQQFGAKAENVNFSLPESVNTINKEIQELTNNKIKNLIPKSFLGASTKIVLLNAVYFKGNWLKAFNPARSKIRPFYAITNQVIPTKMMNSRNYFKVAYVKEADARAIELPYTGSRMSMIILLPNEYWGFARLESALSPKLLNSIDKRLRRKTLLEVTIPKFKIEASLNLKRVLSNLGITELFRVNADLSGISESKGLYVSDAFHRAFMEINEKGTEAAAATVFRIIARSSRIPYVETFIADHPFIFLIRDNRTKMILFMGRFFTPERG